MRRKKNVPLTIAELAERLGGRVDTPPSPANGPATAGPDAELTNLATLAEAGPGDLSFVSGAKFLAEAAASGAGAFLVAGEDRVAGRPCIVVEHVWRAVLKVFDIWWPDEKPAPGVHPSAVVDPTAEVHSTASVGPLAVIEAGARIGAGAEIGAQCFVGRDARIGDGTLLHPHVTVLERVEVGRQVILYPGCVLGADGFGYEVMDNRAVKIPQVGTVIVEDGVEIGANTCVDRAFLHETRIGAGTKIDNLVQIAHNVRIGRSCGLASQVGIAGSTVVGDGVIMWGQVGVPDHIRIGSGAVILAQSGVKDDVPEGQTYFGAPAVPVREGARQVMAIKQLPELLRRVRTLEKEVGRLTGT